MKRWLDGGIALLGGISGYFYGGWSSLLSTLALFIVTDWVTGLMAARTEGTVSSKIGWAGIKKKVALLILVGLMYRVDVMLGTNTMFRDMVTFFYLANELISIVENMGRLGLPIPDVVKKAIAILTEKGTSHDEPNA